MMGEKGLESPDEGPKTPSRGGRAGDHMRRFEVPSDGWESRYEWLETSRG